MIREEVAEIVTYCKDHQVTYKSRLAELNILVWRFYDSKSRYAEKQSSGNQSQGTFIEQPQNGTFIPVSSFVAQSGCKSKGEPSLDFKSIEIRTSSGNAIRIQGELSAQELPDQLSLFTTEELSSTAKTEIEEEVCKAEEKIAKAIKVREKTAHKLLDTSALQVETVDLYPESTTGEDGKLKDDLVEIETEEILRLERIPAKVYIVKTIRH